MIGRLRGPLVALVMLGVFTAAVGYGGYRVIRHLTGWGADAGSSHGPLRIEIEDATLRRVDVSDLCSLPSCSPSTTRRTSVGS